MEDNLQELLNEANEEYVIINKNKNDILNGMDFNNEEEKLLCDSIITNLEKDISNGIRNMKTVQIPFIGCVRINPIKRKIRDDFEHFKFARRNMTKEEYRQYFSNYIKEAKKEQEDKDKLKLINNRIRNDNKEKYDLLFKKLGKVYADTFIYAIRLLKEVPFDAEWEEQYQSLKNINNND